MRTKLKTYYDLEDLEHSPVKALRDQFERCMMEADDAQNEAEVIMDELKRRGKWKE